MAMQRSIGLIGLTFVAVSGVLGSGWLFAPLEAARIAGPAAVISWMIGGVAMLLVALTFAEVSAFLPVAGGIGRIPHFSHGNVVSTVLGWTAWVGYATNPPIEVVAMMGYAAQEFPWLFEPGHQEMLTPAGWGVAVALLALLTVLNAFGVALFAAINTTITWGKLIIPVVLGITLIASQFEWGNFTEAPGGFAPAGLEGILAAVSTGGVVFAFIGFRHAIDLAGEVRRPQVTIPLALGLSIIICALVYLLVQTAFIGAMPPEQLANGWTGLRFEGQFGPLAFLASHLGFLWLMAMLYGGAFIGPFGGALVATGSNARLAMALGQNGLFPALFERLSRLGVPLNALILNLVVAVLLLVLLPFREIVNLNTSALTLSFCAGPLSLYALRQQMPDAERRFRLPVAAFMAPLAFVVATLVVFWSGWNTMWHLGVALVLGMVVFAIREATMPRGLAHFDGRSAMWLVPYLLGLGLLSWLGTFGGGLAVLPFGWDILAVTVFAVAIFFFAHRCRLSQAQVDRYLAEEAEMEKEEYGT